MRRGRKCGSNWATAASCLNKTEKRFFQCNLFAHSPPDRRPSDKYPVNTSPPQYLCKNVSLQCCLVAAVIHIQSVRSQICVYIHNVFTTERRWSGKGIKDIGTAVNAACHFGFGHACHIFASPGVGFGVDTVTGFTSTNCYKYHDIVLKQALWNQRSMILVGYC
jgi:hypothetical protein